MTEREYDMLNRLIKITSDGETIEYQYYEDGKRKSVIYPGATETYTYYQTGHLHTLENRRADATVIDSYSYTYDPAGNQLSKTDAKGVTLYEYDSLNRLKKVTEPNGRVTEYTFDLAGNRKTEKVTSSGNVKDLREGTDFYIASDGKAYYGSGPGAKKDTGVIVPPAGSLASLGIQSTGSTPVLKSGSLADTGSFSLLKVIALIYQNTHY